MGSNSIRIVETYRQYRPPFDATKLVQEMLATVPEKYLVGLECVLLRNTGSLTRQERRGKVWSRKRKVRRAEALGEYHGGREPFIELRIDSIVEWMGKIGWFPMFRSLLLASVLFHELGHHIHRKVRPQHAEAEDVADTWGRKLSGNFVRKRFWYAVPLLIPAAKIYRFAKRWQTAR